MIENRDTRDTCYTSVRRYTVVVWLCCLCHSLLLAEITHWCVVKDNIFVKLS